MGLARKFEELEIWQEARALNRIIWGEFKECREFAFRDQIRRAALSVMNNKRRTLKDFAYFLDLGGSFKGEPPKTAFRSWVEGDGSV
jgi:hypothetical protein